MKLEKVQLPGGGVHFIAPVKIYGNIARFIVDSGASESALCPGWVMMHGLIAKTEKTNRTIVGATNIATKACKIVTPGGIYVGTTNLPIVSLLTVAIEGVQMTYKQLGLKPPDGLLGNDALAKFGAVLDMNKQTLKFKGQ